MNFQINSEQFQLTDIMKSRITTSLEKISSHLRTEPHFKVFLAQPAKDLYSVKIELQTKGQHIMGKSEGPELFSALSGAKKSVLRQVDDKNSKRASSRHEPGPSLAAEEEEAD